MAGSPFPAGGAGAGSTVASQGSLQVAAGGHFLLAVDPGSNQVSVCSPSTPPCPASRATGSRQTAR
jgi:hypothetical protein